MQTTIGNLQSHMNGIPFATLSTSFQDAFQVARQLDLGFLWIDALYIIQDDKQDWEEQCPRMENVYKNALVTIVAIDAENSLVDKTNRNLHLVHLALTSNATFTQGPAGLPSRVGLDASGSFARVHAHHSF